MPAGAKPGGVKETARRFALKFTRKSDAASKPRKPPAPKVSTEQPITRPPKVKELTPELREQILQNYEQEITGGGATAREIVIRISDKLWVTRKAVNHVVHKILNPEVPITPELKARIIEMYGDYVARGERPEGGRRATIGKALGVPFRQVRDIVYDWAQTQYAKSPTAELSREQRFELEKIYCEELDKQRYSLSELPGKIAERVGYTNAFQVARWFDILHDDESKFDKVADVSPEVERQILEIYRQYLAAPAPPDQGLHFTIATKIGNINQRQAHKVLQNYRNQRRAEYPLK